MSNRLHYLMCSILLLCAFPASVFSIEPTWSIDLGSVFDNREGDDKMYDDKTFFSSHLRLRLDCDSPLTIESRGSRVDTTTGKWR